MSIFSHVPVPDHDRPTTSAGRAASESDLAMAQRTELHLDLPDEALTVLAAPVRHVVRPEYPGASDHVMTLAVYELAGGAR